MTPPDGHADLAHPARGRGWRLAVALAMAACCAAAGWAAYAIALQRYVATRAEEAGQRTTFYAQNLRSTLARYESLPRLAALEHVLHVALLQGAQAGDATMRRAANAYLKEVQAATDLAAAHLINTTGLTIAASNWDLPTSFVGQNYAFRPYFAEAMREGLGRFYGVGNTTGETGYFVAAPVREDAKPIGVVVVKVNLDAFEASLSRSGDTVLLVDRHGVIFLSSVPEWKYRTLGALSPEQQTALDATRQYAPHTLTPLDTQDGGVPFSADQPPQAVRVALPGKSVSTLRVQYRPVGLLGWQVAVLIDPRDEQRTALVAGASAAFAMGLVFSVFVALRLRTRRREEQRRARAALREVQRDLEARIAQRTAELTSANTALAGKVEALDAAQRILRETRDAAVQAGKLAVLGQMAAGITHELNQPLTALTTLSDNANQLAERGRIDEVRGNLTHISQLAERMGRIVSHIKAFSRKGDAARAAVSVDEAIRQALMLVETRRRQVGVTVTAPLVPADLAVWANAVRLEQVLVNLIRNAIDAMAETAQPESAAVHVRVEPIENWVRITVRDVGPGIPSDVLPRLFEPFFTTKDDGLGLGLGLAISLAIIEDFGGRLVGQNADDGAGGAEFVIELERVVKPHA
ncbi:ATP-binding protein [Ralstonia insidiosa]|jgi:two-component system C4-dicarboxylate transport sensor histidine kinase DctB|uniref:sensor histidine kinase n=1 Tax=Ralstonia TaxID=48736 RepID=UPI00066490B1|nr:ATP-binding protein [Ralstonia insidiosa]KMW45532.1 C4-dicarboxylate ABC transporter [Ralstonia sp. MD27]MBX3772356.1 sensor histidine kinase [Ralstonia pickettii]NOZ98555.1 sensor histidine kinase [Betaproteobacteria bacterium]MBA9857012.1 sensor histidine kinase [Ralstonia insidiosa]MBA9870112.1 sensor histidine kinase [Ralstonia insidiosa]